MKLYIFSAMLLILNIYLVILQKHEVHMFQQNSYMYSRYLRWFAGKGKKTDLIRGAIAFAFLPVYLAGYEEAAYICLAVYYLVLILLRGKTQEKKKLVYTNRVKRLFATISVLLIFNLMFILSSYFNLFIGLGIYLAIAIFLAAFPQIILIIADLVIRPLEDLIITYYTMDAAKKIRDHRDLTVIGITGSFGKTSTKHILNDILKMRYNVLMTPESYNTALGVVRTIREKLKPTHEIFIAEMGAKKRHDIEEICNIVKPLHGIITKVGLQHLETFKTPENILRTKLELFDSLPFYGVAYINKDDKNIMNSIGKKQMKKIFYSMKTKDCDYYLHDVTSGSEGMHFYVTTQAGESLDFRTKLLGRHNLYNILCSVCCANVLGMSLEEISARVRDLRPIPHRLELRKISENSLIIDDAYNSNPEGAKEALNVLKSFMHYHRILITPGMVELGDRQNELNMEFGKEAAAACDNIILVGRKQTLPILEGIKSAGFNMDNCFVAGNLNEALKKAEEIKEDKKVILFENDLPDIYNE